MIPKVYIKNMGCKVNAFDGYVIENQLKQKGFLLSNSPNDSDITILNTCSVTLAAEKEARYLLRRYKRDNPKVMNIITGCYAQIDGKSIASLKDADYIISNEKKTELADIVEKFWQSKILGQEETFSKFSEEDKLIEKNRQSQFKSSLVFFDSTHQEEKVRSFLKIQDGCNGFCAYCQIPFARGASRSVPRTQILQEAESLAARGVSEIVLTGIHIGDWGRDLEEENKHPSPLGDLLKDLLKISVNRWRISSLEPSEIHDEFLESCSIFSHKICPHFHLPLQSGSNPILRLMGRPYTAEDYLQSLEQIRGIFPDVHLSADVIVGFPGETEEDFKRTCHVLQEGKLGSLHIFPYSPRPGTRALKYPDHLPQNIIKERALELKKIGEKLFFEYSQMWIGECVPVLWENYGSQDLPKGKTRHYLDVVSSSLHKNQKPNLETWVKIKGRFKEKIFLGEPYVF